MNSTYANQWWETKLADNYALQPKHYAALALVTPDAFPLVDLGAGIGIFLAAVEQAFPEARCEGLELSEVAIVKKACQAPIGQGSLLEWRPEAPVQTLALLDVIEHLHDPEQVLTSLAPHTAQLLITCPNFNFLTARWDVLRGRVPFQNRPARGGHVFWCQYAALKAMFARAGFTVAAENHLYPRHHWPLARALGRRRPALFAHQFVFLLIRHPS